MRLVIGANVWASFKSRCPLTHHVSRCILGIHQDKGEKALEEKNPESVEDKV